MSKKFNADGSVMEENDPNLEGQEDKTPKDEFVSKKAYEEVSKDMHKNKKLASDLAAELNRIKIEQEQARIASLQEKEEYKTLWEEERKSKAEEKAAIEAERAAIVNRLKIDAVEKLTGGFKKAEYARQFVNADNIGQDAEGNILQSDVQKEADRIQQNYAELLNVAISTRMPTGAAKPINGSEKSFNDYTADEIKVMQREALLAANQKK